jgi:hypothetical protein
MPFDLASSVPVAEPPKGGFDMASAKPVGGAPSTREFQENGGAPTNAAENPTSLMNILGAATEPGLAMLSGAVATPIAGLAGTGAMVTNALGVTNTSPADLVRRIQGMAYKPQTTGGKNAMTAFQYPLQKVAQAGQWAGGKALDATGSPMLATAVDTAMQAIPQVLLGKAGADALPVGRMAREGVAPEVQALADKGVTMTPGQRRGGMTNRLEQAAESVPLVGDIIKSARGKSVNQFSDAAVNDSLAPIGEKLAPGVTGHDAIKEAYTKLGERYDDVLPKLTGSLDGSGPKLLAAPGAPAAAAPITLRAELAGLKNAAAQRLPARESETFTQFVDREVIGKFDKSGAISGAGLKDIQQTLRKEISDFRKGGPYERKLADALTETDAAVRKMLTRENPQHAAELAKIDAGYALFKRAQKAASYSTTTGVFTPAQYQRAVKALDTSKDKARTAEGAALGQDMGKAGQKVLGSTVPDSGSPFRLATIDALLGGGGAAALGPKGVAAGLAVPAMYSNTGLRAMQSMYMKPPAVGNAAVRALPVGAMPAGTPVEKALQDDPQLRALLGLGTGIAGQ